MTSAGPEAGSERGGRTGCKMGEGEAINQSSDSF